MLFTIPVTRKGLLPMPEISELIRQRRSVRTYKSQVLNENDVHRLQDLLHTVNTTGPFGSTIRYELVILNNDEIEQLQKMIHYGFIKGSPAFVVGMMEPRDRSLTDFGYLMEELILQTVGLGFDTCWLGGSLNKQSFMNRLQISEKESIPAIFSVGFELPKKRVYDSVIRTTLQGNRRKPWEELFFNGAISVPLGKDACGPYQAPLEMVRLGPSASNKQPWRVITGEPGREFHFFMVRNVIYSRFLKMRGKSDLQRMDIGIAMVHFELTAREMGLRGEWIVHGKTLLVFPSNFEYTATWVDHDA
jgi:nitroreductase